MNKSDYDSALRLLEAVADTTPDFNYVFDLTGRFLYANRRLLEVWGTTLEDAVGKSLPELGYPQWHVDMHLAEIAAVIRTKKPITGEVPFTGGSGISGVYEYIFTPVLDKSGEVVLIAGTTRDVTLRKAAQEQTLTILESITDGFLDLDSDWRFTYVNKQAEVILGKPREELLGKTIWDCYPGIVGSPFEETYRKAAEQKISSSVTSFYSAHDRWYEAHASPTDNGISIYFRDVSHRLRTEVALRESEERFRAAFDQSVVGIVLSDLNGKILSANAAFCKFVGRTIEELVGHDSKLFTHQDDISRNITNISALKDQGSSSSVVYEKRYLRKDGVIVEAQVSLTTVLDNGGQAISLVAIIEDLTQRKLIESDRERLLARERIARSDAERASQMKDEFLATLSHELRTPLNAILGWAQILNKNKNIPKDISDGIVIIERNARAQTQIIEDLLDMSRIISGKLQLNVQRVDLATVVGAAIDTVRPAANAKGVKLRAVLDTFSAPVSGDPSRLQQVFWNLLTNAVKFTPKGGSVQVILERINSHIEVSVIDTGEGIDTDFLQHVFDRFRQGDGATTRRYGGLGLGLAIVKQLVELHGGIARVKSGGLGSGATFTVELPLTVIHPDPASTEEKRHPRPSNIIGQIEDTCAKIEGLKVLVVDDEPDARALVKRLLEDCKAIVITAASADEAVSLLQSERPDVMVSDIGMPIEDGYSLIRRVRALPASRGGETPALALTAYARAQDRLNAMLAGFQSHVVKPVEAVELITLVAILAKRA